MTNDVLVADAPSSKEETWRYTPVNEIQSRISSALSAARSAPLASGSLDIGSIANKFDGPALVFVNGFFNEEYSSIQNLPSGIYCGTAAQYGQISQELISKNNSVRTIKGLNVGDNDFDVALVVADQNVTLHSPIHVVQVLVGSDSKDSATISHARCIVDLGNDSHITLVETFCGFGSNGVTDSATTIRLGENARLDHCRIQNEQLDSTHVGNTRVEQAKNSKFHMSSITLGADIARNAVDVHLDNEDAVMDLTGVNITRDNQQHDTVVTADHCASYCASNQRFVGVANDHGHASFGGEIIVQKGTVGTDAHQTNRNLILNSHAKADTRPWLRIFADDVKCTHGATVGRLDENALFYLQSRGIEVGQARTMLIDAFIAEITETIAHESVRSAVDDLISTITHS